MIKFMRKSEKKLHVYERPINLMKSHSRLKVPTLIYSKLRPVIWDPSFLLFIQYYTQKRNIEFLIRVLLVDTGAKSCLPNLI